jgi:hypothetical protein
MPDYLRIEGISGCAQTRATNNAARNTFSSTNSWANVNQREVACTASEISNQYKFVMIERGLVIMCGCYGLQLELYGFVASALEGRSKSALCINVIFLVLCSHKMNGSSDYCRPDPDPELMFRLFSQVPQNPCYQILNCVTAAENLRAVKVATAKERFEGLDQSPLHVRSEILFNALWTGPRLQNVGTAYLRLLKI